MGRPACLKNLLQTAHVNIPSPTESHKPPKKLPRGPSSLTLEAPWHPTGRLPQVFLADVLPRGSPDPLELTTTAAASALGPRTSSARQAVWPALAVSGGAGHRGSPPLPTQGAHHWEVQVGARVCAPPSPHPAVYPAGSQEPGLLLCFTPNRDGRAGPGEQNAGGIVTGPGFGLGFLSPLLCRPSPAAGAPRSGKRDPPCPAGSPGQLLPGGNSTGST